MKNKKISVKNSILNNPNIVVATDFTNLYWKGDEFYLATVIDQFTREVIGYDIGFNHDQDFIIGTTKKAICKSFKLFGFLPKWFHSDQGSEYRSHKHLSLLRENLITPSMSKKASPWENGMQEGFYLKLKLEIGNLNKFNSLEEAIKGVYDYIYYYNNKRIHTAIKMSPVQFRKIQQDKIRNKVKNNLNYFNEKKIILNKLKKEIKENLVKK